MVASAERGGDMSDEAHAERVKKTAQSVLVVDDEPQNLFLLGDFLSSDYEVRVATSGPQALRIAAETPRPDIVLLDVMMPDMDGHEVLRRLRADPATADIPVIFVTARTQDTDEEEGLSLGAQDYIAKPIVPAILLARVRAQLDLKRARDVLADHNAALEQEICRRVGEKLLVQDVTIAALASLAEARDKDTGRHIQRTQEYVRILAQALSQDPRHADALDARQVELIVKAAPLHDIGKVATPDSVLLKPGRLTPAEFDVIKMHARVGCEAIEGAISLARLGAQGLSEDETSEALEFMAIAAEIAHYHHEKWDGSGYPEGLSGRDIPLAARIMAVADVYDALSTRRVYKEALPPDTVHAHMIEGSGSHFDPDVIEAYVARRDDFLRVALALSDPPPAGR
jgi:putative two-component system response regulator